MRNIDEIDREGTDRQMATYRHDLHWNFRRALLRGAPGLEYSCRERRGIDRHFQLRPQIDERAHMVLVTMGEHQRQNVFALFDQVADVRQDEIDAWQMLFGGEGDAAIDDDPLPPAIVAETVDREVHPDLANAAKRCEYQFVLHDQN